MRSAAGIVARTSACARALFFGCAALAPEAVLAQEDGIAPKLEAPPPYAPDVKPASGEGEAAIARFDVPEGFRVELWAAEPLLANPVAFDAADSGAVYVCESFRLHKGVTDLREHMDWLDDDQASRSVEDLVAMFEKHLGPKFAETTAVERERLRVLRDQDGDGRADRSRVFSDAFGDPADGIGAGVLEVEGDVYFTCMPHLWQLSDADGDDRADTCRSLSYGYGVHVQFLGHDLHGLVVGPDGYLYFSCGDRGLKVDLPNGVLIDHTESGAVLRCELDGTGLELYATGLRNPQELAFDDRGNLFTGDNNGDGGDRARLVHVVLGGDSGWRNGWQWVQEPQPRGFFNAEKLWQPAFEGQAAWIVPPIANLASGPSGLSRDPGGALPGPWAGRFLLCDFTGDPKSSSILAFALEPKGSSFALGAVDPIVKGSLVTDCEIGPDGALWFSDWVEGWGQTGKGRIYRAFDPGRIASDAARETRALLAGSWRERGAGELARLLGHRDQRVRMHAELELARRGNEGWSRLVAAARTGDSLLARLHGLWGAGLLARREPARDRAVFLELVRDEESEVRAQAARVLGDLRHEPAFGALVRLLNEENPRVRLQASLALSRLSSADAESAIGPLLAMLHEIGAGDPVLRHAGVLALSTCANGQQLAVLRRSREPDLRLAAVVALRRQESPRLAEFLEDPDPRVVAEAARAIYDVPLPGMLWQLAMLTRSETVTDPNLLRRAIHAHWRIGTDTNAAELARYSLRTDQDPGLRREALLLLGKWRAPHARDPLLGLWRPLATRDDRNLREIVRFLNDEQVAFAPEGVARAWIDLAGQYQAGIAVPQLSRWALDPKAAVPLRVASLSSLEKIAPEGLQALLEGAITDAQDEVRAAALAALERVAPRAALPYLALAARGARAERRAAYEALGRIPVPEAEGLLEAELERLAIGYVPGELALDLVLACERRATPAMLARLAELRAPRAAEPVLAPWLDSLQGGDAERGRKVFRTKTELSCLRCHQIESPYAPNPEGGLVGPDLRGVGARLTRLELLESIVDPNRRIGAGFRASVVHLTDGHAVEGRLIEETPELLRLRDKDDQVIEVPRAEVESVKSGLSSMPENLRDRLSREEMRDVIEFLSRQ